VLLLHKPAAFSSCILTGSHILPPLLLLLLLLQVIAEHGPGLSLAAVDDMPYADAVVKEALRLAPPAGAMMRRTLVDLQVRLLCYCYNCYVTVTTVMLRQSSTEHYAWLHLQEPSCAGHWWTCK
jgi:hypothetical protein